MQAFKQAESIKKPDPLLVLKDVYAEDIPILREQRESLEKHLKAFGDKYSLDQYEPIGSQAAINE